MNEDVFPIENRDFPRSLVDRSQIPASSISYPQEEREMLRRDPCEDGNRGAGRYSLGDPVRLGGSRQGSLNYKLFFWDQTCSKCMVDLKDIPSMVYCLGW